MIRICYIDADNQSITSKFLKGVGRQSGPNQTTQAIMCVMGDRYNMHQLRKNEWLIVSLDIDNGANTFKFIDATDSPVIPGPYQKAMTIYIDGESLFPDDSSYVPSELLPIIEWKIGITEKRDTSIDKILS